MAGLEVESNKTASVTANGTLVVEPSDGKDVMEKATVTVAVPLEANKTATIDASQYAAPVEITPSDGKTAMQKATVTVTNIPVLEANKTATIDVSQYNEPVEITPSSQKDAMQKTTVTLTNIPTVDLEDNKTSTINVSEYTEPVEITPTEGKDGMKKATVTLSNIPVAGATLYAWKDENDNVAYTKSATPEAEGDCFLCAVTGLSSDTIKEVGEGSITVTISEADVEFSRYSDGDIEL